MLFDLEQCAKVIVRHWSRLGIDCGTVRFLGGCNVALLAVQPPQIEPRLGAHWVYDDRLAERRLGTIRIILVVNEQEAKIYPRRHQLRRHKESLPVRYFGHGGIPFRLPQKPPQKAPSTGALGVHLDSPTIRLLGTRRVLFPGLEEGAEGDPSRRIFRACPHCSAARRLILGNILLLRLEKDRQVAQCRCALGVQLDSLAVGSLAPSGVTLLAIQQIPQVIPQHGACGVSINRPAVRSFGFGNVLPSLKKQPEISPGSRVHGICVDRTPKGVLGGSHVSLARLEQEAQIEPRFRIARVDVDCLAVGRLGASDVVPLSLQEESKGCPRACRSRVGHDCPSVNCLGTRHVFLLLDQQ
mmetsp:Transcript_20109/g.52197  ORF Transcript_20109/g.52197 Transcript_20109/m.52197 type:complete len:355 (+) Transcript_20109:405-1469(+)